MTFDIVCAIIFLISLGVIIFILLKKIPLLYLLPQYGQPSSFATKNKFLLLVENKTGNFLKLIKNQVYLQKILCWIKIIVIKIEVKIDYLLQKIRHKKSEK